MQQDFFRNVSLSDRQSVRSTDRRKVRSGSRGRALRDESSFASQIGNVLGRRRLKSRPMPRWRRFMPRLCPQSIKSRPQMSSRCLINIYADYAWFAPILLIAFLEKSMSLNMSTERWNIKCGKGNIITRDKEWQ